MIKAKIINKQMTIIVIFFERLALFLHPYFT
jgi:hypothetical protein